MTLWPWVQIILTVKEYIRQALWRSIGSFWFFLIQCYPQTNRQQLLKASETLAGQKRRVSGPTSDLLSQNLHFNKSP